MNMQEILKEYHKLDEQHAVEMSDELAAEVAAMLNQLQDRGITFVQHQGWTDEDIRYVASMMCSLYDSCGDESIRLIMHSKPIIAGSLMLTAILISAGLLESKASAEPLAHPAEAPSEASLPSEASGA